MKKNIIVLFFVAFFFSSAYFFITNDFDGGEVTFERAILLGVVFFVVSAGMQLVMRKRYESRKEEQKQASEVNSEFPIEEFVRVIGGGNNIEAVDFEASRVKITLVEVDQIDQESLKDLVPAGASLSGNELQINNVDQAEWVAGEIKKIFG